MVLFAGPDADNALPVRKTKMDCGGHYYFFHLEPGDYLMVVEAEGFHPEKGFVFVEPGTGGRAPLPIATISGVGLRVIGYCIWQPGPNCHPPICCVVDDPQGRSNGPGAPGLSYRHIGGIAGRLALKVTRSFSVQWRPGTIRDGRPRRSQVVREAWDASEFTASRRVKDIRDSVAHSSGLVP